MNFIIWIIVGGIIGWLAGTIMKTNAEQGIFLNIVIGVAGAFLASLFLMPIFGIGTINPDDFSAASFFVSLLGAIVFLAITNLLGRRSLR